VGQALLCLVLLRVGWLLVCGGRVSGLWFLSLGALFYFVIMVLIFLVIKFSCFFNNNNNEVLWIK